MRVELLRNGLYLISGGGGNTLLRFSGNGLILVDGKLPGQYRALMSQVRKVNKLSDLPVRALVITNHHQGHTGNNAQFLAAGVTIVAHENAQKRLLDLASTEGVRSAPVVIGFERERTLQLGGIDVRLMHFGRACTDGDAVVYFPGLRVVAAGELFTPDTPNPDVMAVGSLVDWATVLAKVLELDLDLAVPSTGPAVSRSEIESFKQKLDTLTSRASEFVGGGVSKERLMTRLRTDDLGWQSDLDGEALERFHAELWRASR